MLVSSLCALAGIYSSGNVNGSGTSLGISIPDGNSSGVFTTIGVSGENISLSDITVTLNVSGGYNGDLYAYLSYNGTLVTLLNRVGVGTINGGTTFGSSGAGFINVTLASSGSNVHWTSGTLNGGTYLADGRNVDPLSSPSAFNADGTQNLDASYGGMNPNGTWTLFFADMSSGGGNSMLNGWSLDVQAVPEPVNVVLGIFGGLFGVIGLICHFRKRAVTPDDV